MSQACISDFFLRFKTSLESKFQKQRFSAFGLASFWSREWRCTTNDRLELGLRKWQCSTVERSLAGRKVTAGSGYVGWTWALEKSTSRNLHKMWVFTSAIKKTNYQQYGKYVAININILIILIHLLTYTGF